MDISARDARKYIDQLAAIDTRAGDLMREWVEKNGTGDMKAMADYAYALVQKYGEASAALSAEMYDATAEAQGATLPPAVPAEPAGYGEVAKTMYGIRKQSLNPESYASGVSRLVKRTGADTTLHNALRDGAEFAWVPFGDTCPFCIALASRGWQPISEKALKNGHAEHIHANCNCGYMTRQDGKSGVAGYDPQKYADMYYGAEGSTPGERINSMRRMQYAGHPEKYREQKREAYIKNNLLLDKRPEPLSRIYVNHSDRLYEYLKKVKPIDGYDDYAVHGVFQKPLVEYETNGGKIVQYNAREIADMIRSDPTYKGGRIRLLACGTGSSRSRFAQELANELGVVVLAPSEALWVGKEGDLFITDSEALADMWYNKGNIDNSFKSTGKWIPIGPQRNRKNEK